MLLFFRFLSEFVFECSPLVLSQLGITCADDSVMHALTSRSDVIKQAYAFLDIEKLQAENEGKCLGNIVILLLLLLLSQQALTKRIKHVSITTITSIKSILCNKTFFVGIFNDFFYSELSCL